MLKSEDLDLFPRFDGIPPYASCLRALEECPLVIGIIDRQIKQFVKAGELPSELFDRPYFVAPNPKDEI